MCRSGFRRHAGRVLDSQDRQAMSSDQEIIVEDPDAPVEESPMVAGVRPVETVFFCMLVALTLYPSVLLAAANLYGGVSNVVNRLDEGKVFVTRDQLRRVMQVFVPTFL